MEKNLKLNYKRTLIIGFAFFSILMVWQGYNAYCPLYLKTLLYSILVEKNATEYQMKCWNARFKWYFIKWAFRKIKHLDSDADIADARECFANLDKIEVVLSGSINVKLDNKYYLDSLLSKANVVGTPGSGFGPAGEHYFRLTAFGTKENTIRAIERIRERM